MVFRPVSRRLLSFKTYPTPNTNALKFVLSECEIIPFSQTFEFTSSLQAIHSPLALKLFKLRGVSSIMLGKDFVTINKQDHINWAELRPQVVDMLDGFLSEKSNLTVTKELLEKARQELAQSAEQDSEVVSMIKELIETRIRPAVQDDGGDIQFMGFDAETGTVFLKLQGACKTCSSSENTLKHGIEAMMKHYIEEVTLVEQILDPEEEVALKEFDRLEQNLKSKRGEAEDRGPPSL